MWLSKNSDVMCYWSFKPIKSCSSRPSQVIALWLDEMQPQSRKRLSHNRNNMSLANRKLATNVTPDDIILLVHSSFMVQCQCDVSKKGAGNQFRGNWECLGAQEGKLCTFFQDAPTRTMMPLIDPLATVEGTMAMVWWIIQHVSSFWTHRKHALRG